MLPGASKGFACSLELSQNPKPSTLNPKFSTLVAKPWVSRVLWGGEVKGIRALRRTKLIDSWLKTPGPSESKCQKSYITLSCAMLYYVILYCLIVYNEYSMPKCHIAISLSCMCEPGSNG